MHCLRPRQIVNPHYSKRNEKGSSNLDIWRGVNAAPGAYPEDYYIIIPCGTCLGCLRDKARSWRVRLLHEHIFGGHAVTQCLTLTISDENLHRFNSKLDCSRAFRDFIDRLRYYSSGRKCPKRFFVSELGEQKGRLHFHGFIFDGHYTEEQLRRAWSYGFVRVRELKSARQLSYATKYITKPSVRWHSPMVFVSPGLGKSYTLSPIWREWHKAGDSTTPINYCVRFDSFVYALPRYYRDKIFTASEIAAFKESLSEDDKPFEKFLGRRSFSDPLAYCKARDDLLQTSIRSNKSKTVTISPPSLIKQYNPFLEPPEEFKI